MIAFYRPDDTTGTTWRLIGAKQEALAIAVERLKVVQEREKGS